MVGAGHGEVMAPEDLHGFPGVVHGGAVAALFHRVTLPRPPFRLRLALPRGVPVATRLSLGTGSAGLEARLALRQGDRLLAEASISRDPGPGPDPSSGAIPAGTSGAGVEDARPVPRTATCLACGPDNPLGAQVQLRVDPDRVFARYRTPPAYLGQHGRSHPALAFILLDELGWWLGALHLREAGVTTELDVVFQEDLPAGPLQVVGDRRAVALDEDPRGRFVTARPAILSTGGDVLAFATVRFAGSPAYTRRLLGPFLARTPIEALREVFPHAGEGSTQT